MTKVAPRRGPALRVEHFSDGCLLASLDDIMIAVWSGKPKPEHLSALRHSVESVGRAYGRGSSVHMLLNRPELPEKRVRDGMTQITRDYADRTIASALVLNGDGFWASAIRGLATSLHYLGSERGRFKLRVCATLEEAAAWLAPVHSAGSRRVMEVAELQRALIALRGRASAHAAALSSARPRHPSTPRR